MTELNTSAHSIKPKLREIKTEPAVEEGQSGVLLSDPIGVSSKTVFVPSSLALLLSLIDGTRDIGTLIAGYQLRTGRYLGCSQIEDFIRNLDEAFFIDNERFAQAYKTVLDDYRSASSRPLVLAGKSYPDNVEELEAFLKEHLDQIEDNGKNDYVGDIKGLISPHIDFARGSKTYAKVWLKAKAAVREAELFIILGTDHKEGDGRITLTHQSYETPWGIMPTDQDIVAQFKKQIGEGIFERELNHRSEHSVEAAIIWLHYLLEGKTCQILPVICGSFPSFIESCKSPIETPHIASTVEVLKEVISNRRTIIIAAADLAHQGPAFGDPIPLDLAEKVRMAEQDKKLIDIISRGNAEDFFSEIKNERDRRHVCGVPPIYIALSVLSEISGKSIDYQQCPASEDGTSFVSICGLLFHSQK